jgi:hypothetical protein
MFMIHSGPAGGKSKQWASTAQWSDRAETAQNRHPVDIFFLMRKFGEVGGGVWGLNEQSRPTPYVQHSPDCTSVVHSGVGWGGGRVGCVVGCVGCEGCVECVGCNEQSRPLLTFDIPQTALVATLDTYDFIAKT